MWVFRLSLGFSLFGLAGVVVLGAPVVREGSGLIAWGALWFGAAYLVWQGVRAFQGKIQLPQTQTAAQPGLSAASDVPPTSECSSRPRESSATFPPPGSQENGALDTDRHRPPEQVNSRDVMKAAAETVEGAVFFMRRVWIVLALVLLVPISLGLSIGGIFLLVKSDVAQAAVALLAAGFIGWYCVRPLCRHWNGDENPQTNGSETGTDSEPERRTVSTAGTVSTDTDPGSSPPPPVLSLPEEFLLLCHLTSGKVHDYAHTALGCAAAELGELALRRRLRIVPLKKIKVFGAESYLTPGKIHLLDTTPTGLPWADILLAELESHVAAKGGPIGLRKWFRLRRDEALILHREGLIQHVVLLHDYRGERHYPDSARRNVLINQLQSANSELVPMDEHMLLLLDLLEGAGLEERLGLTSSMRQRSDRARGVGAVAAIPEHMRDTSAVLSIRMSARNSAGNSDADDGGE